MLRDIIKFIDIYYTKPKFFIYKKERFSTVLGGILSILTIASIFSLSCYFLYQVFSRTNATIIYNKNTQIMNVLNHSNVPIMIGIFDTMGNKIQNVEKIYYLKSKYFAFYMNETTGNVESIKFDVDIERCDLNKHFPENENLFKQMPYIDNFYCLIPNKYNLTLFGKFGDIRGFSYIDFDFYKCKNSTEVENDTNKNQCYSIDTIDDIINWSVASIGYLDYDINHSDIFNPTTLILKTEILTLSPILFKRMFINKKMTQYRTDYGLFFEDYKKIEFFQHDSSYITYSINQESQLSYFSTVTLQTAGQTDVYFRDYIKIQNCLANIGGVIKGIITLITILFSIFFEKMFYCELVNKVFVKNKDNIIFESNNLGQRANSFNLGFDCKNRTLNELNLKSKISKNNFISEKNKGSTYIDKHKTESKFLNLNLLKLDSEKNKIEKAKLLNKKIELSIKDYVCCCFNLHNSESLKNLDLYKDVIEKKLSIEMIIKYFNCLEKIYDNHAFETFLENEENFANIEKLKKDKFSEYDNKELFGNVKNMKNNTSQQKLI